MAQTQHVRTRYAIRLWDPSQPTLGTWWHCQGLPKEMSFSRAILYGSIHDAERAAKAWKFRQAIERGGIQFEIVPVKCEFVE